MNKTTIKEKQKDKKKKENVREERKNPVAQILQGSCPPLHGL